MINSNHKAIGAISLSNSMMNESIIQRLSNELLAQVQRLNYMLSYSFK